MRRPSRALLACASIATALFVSGCGSTVGLGANGQAINNASGSGLDDGLSSGLDGVGTNDPTQAPTSATTGGTGAGSTTTDDSTTEATSDPTYSSDGGAVAVSLPGTSSKPIVVGVTYAKDASAGIAAIGASGTFGDQYTYLKIVIEDINKRGGLNGRQIKPIYYGYDVNPGSPSYQQQDQSTCALFTQDNHIELAWTNLAGDLLIDCLQKKGIPMLDGGSGSGYGKDFYAKNPLYFSPSSLNLDRRSTELVKALKRQGYFNKWNAAQGNANGVTPTKVGVIAYDYPTQVGPIKNSLLPAIKALGYGDPMVKYVAPHDSYGNLTAMQPQIQGAVLQFKAQGVTHVILADDNGVMTLFFMTNAANQNFKPRYGVTSGNNMVVVSQLVGKEQLIGSTGIGWTPLQDLGDEPAKKYQPAAFKACNALMKAHGQEGSSYNPGFAAFYCASANFAKQSIDAGKAIDKLGFAKAMDAVGARFQPLLVPSSFVGPGHHDGLGAMYDYAYSDTCDCMTYLGGAKKL